MSGAECTPSLIARLFLRASRRGRCRPWLLFELDDLSTLVPVAQEQMIPVCLLSTGTCPPNICWDLLKMEVVFSPNAAAFLPQEISITRSLPTDAFVSPPPPLFSLYFP